VNTSVPAVAPIIHKIPSLGCIHDKSLYQLYQYQQSAIQYDFLLKKERKCVFCAVMPLC